MSRASPPPPRLPFRYRLLALLVLLALAIGFLGRIAGAVSATWQWLMATFGIGLGVLVVAALLFLGVRGWLRLLERWHRWLGGLVLVLALFALLALFPGRGLLEVGLGGRFGRLLLGPSLPLGILRIALLVYLGVLLLAPAPTLRVSRGFLRWAAHEVAALALILAALGRLGWRGLKAVSGARSRRMALERPKAVRPQPVRPSKEAKPLAEEPPAPPREAPSAPEVKRLAEEMRGVVEAAPVITSTGWQLPPLDLLERTAEASFGPEEVERRAQMLQQALEEYGVEARVVHWNVGPTVTQFEVEPGWDVKYKEVRERDEEGGVRARREEVSRIRVKVDRITALANDLALALAAPTIRIEAPVPGKSIVGIEVPNSSFSLVPLREVIESPQVQKLKARSRLALALGKGVGGEGLAADLAKMPHLLIAGATGSGKTVFLNSIICCLLMHNTPDDLQFLLIDPKRVEFQLYHALPHLATPVIVDREKAVEALRWLAGEMDSRYRKLAAAGARNIEGYNKTAHPGGALPFLALVVDELADLMMVAWEEVERNLCRLAQLARATGIHLVVATQRPSVDVVTGLIKANFPTRLSFVLSSQVDSRTILDTAGAEKLLGRGDMLFLPTDAAKPRRLQGCFVSDGEIERLTTFWARQRRREPPPLPGAIAEKGEKAPPGEPPADPLLEQARRLAKEHRQLSASFLQRRLQIGFSRAVKLMELLEAEGTIPREEKGGPS